MFRVPFRCFVFAALLAFVARGLASAALTDTLPELGDLQRWSVFSLGVDTTRDEFSGTTVIQGDVGVAGVGDIAVQDTATIQGDVYYRSNGTLTVDPTAQITGARIHDQDDLLDNEAASALATSRHAASFKSNVFAPNDLELGGNRNFTLTGGVGDTVVMKLGNFTLSGNSTFTLQGTATTVFIINVTKQFALSSNSKIVLSGDVQWSNVLFNICGKDSAVTLGGNSSFAGMLMANRRTIQVSGRADITGELIANRVMFTRTGFSGGATVTHPPVVSP